MTDTVLSELFRQFGQVNWAEISMDENSGESKGCGYVQMEYQTEAQTAIFALNKSDLGGKSIAVSRSYSKFESRLTR